MANILKTYTTESEVAAFIAEIIATGKPLKVSVGGKIYEIYATTESEVAARIAEMTSVEKSLEVAVPPTDFWADYDPEKVREALDRYAGSWSDLDAEELKNKLYRARKEGSQPLSQP